MSLDDTWNRLEAHLARAGAGAGHLRGPVAPETLAAAERATGLAWPAELRASLARHDGEGPRGGLLRGWRLLPTNEIAQVWATLDRRHQGGSPPTHRSSVAAADWDPRWLPIAEDGAGNYRCLDLAPAEGGVIGRLLTFWHDSPDREVEAPGLAALLAALVDGLDAGTDIVASGRVRRARRPR